MHYRLASVLTLTLLCLCGSMFAQQIRGDYIETRSADVYTGQCFANGEVNLVGREAILAWHVQNGSWNGVPLDGLTVAAAVRAKATLGDPYGHPYPAKQMGGELLRNVEQTIAVPNGDDCQPRPARGCTVAGRAIRYRTDAFPR